MYQTINAHAAYIVGQVPPGAITRYSWLLDNLIPLNVAVDANYQKLYRGFWRIRFPGAAYCAAYFGHLQANKGNPNLDPQTICLALQPVSPGLQFSFATKMAHMANPHTPIYDENVRQFFFLPTAPAKAEYADRLSHYTNSYAFLIQEYQRVMANNLLAPAIATFRQHFPAAATHTDEKVIDWLLWEFFTLANQGAFQTSDFRHS